MKLFDNTLNGLSMLTGHPFSDICMHIWQNTQSPNAYRKVMLNFRFACIPEPHKRFAHDAVAGGNIGIFIAIIVVVVILTSIVNKQKLKVLAS